jgi:acyl carrier protein
LTDNPHSEFACTAKLKLAVEAEFHITISDEELESFTTVGDVVRPTLNRQA